MVGRSIRGEKRVKNRRPSSFGEGIEQVERRAGEVHITPVERNPNRGNTDRQKLGCLGKKNRHTKFEKEKTSRNHWASKLARVLNGLGGGNKRQNWTPLTRLRLWGG